MFSWLRSLSHNLPIWGKKWRRSPMLTSIIYFYRKTKNPFLWINSWCEIAQLVHFSIYIFSILPWKTPEPNFPKKKQRKQSTSTSSNNLYTIPKTDQFILKTHKFWINCFLSSLIIYFWHSHISQICLMHRGGINFCEMTIFLSVFCWIYIIDEKWSGK